jgi:hypothetical protein
VVTGTPGVAAVVEVSDCRETLLRSALAALSAERELASPYSSVIRLREADEHLAFAARDLVRAVDALPEERQPKGWAS